MMKHSEKAKEVDDIGLKEIIEKVINIVPKDYIKESLPYLVVCEHYGKERVESILNEIISK